MRIGICLSLEFNDSYTFGGKTIKAAGDTRRFLDWYPTVDGRMHPALCETCGRRIIDDYFPDEFVLKRKYDLSTTYEGDLIASRSGREFLLRQSDQDPEFVELPQASGFYWLRPSTLSKIRVDVKRSGVRLGERCPRCAEYSEVLLGIEEGKPPKAKPVHLYCGAISRGVHHTDIAFGSNFFQSPLVILGLGAGAELKTARLTGVQVSEIAILGEG